MSSRTFSSVEIQPHQDFLLLAGRQAPHLFAVRSADQYISGNVFEDSVQGKVQSAAVFINLRRDSTPELWIEGREVSADLLTRLLEADRPVGLRDFVLAVRQNQNIFVNFRHRHPVFSLAHVVSPIGASQRSRKK